MRKAGNPVSDQDIIDSIRSNQKIEPTVRYLYNAYFDSLSMYIKKNQGNDQDAEDFFQEGIVVFIDAVKQDKFRGDSKIKTFLYSVMRNLWLNELKRRKRAMERETLYYEEHPKEEEGIQALIRENEMKKAVASLLEQIGENCQKILILAIYQDKPMKEICEEMGYKNEQVARNTKSKCLKKIENLLDANEDIKQHFKSLLVNG